MKFYINMLDFDHRTQLFFPLLSKELWEMIIHKLLHSTKI